MTLIKAEQIDALYKKLHLDPQASFDVKTTLNTGSLENTLNTGEIFKGTANANNKLESDKVHIYKS